MSIFARAIPLAVVLGLFLSPTAFSQSTTGGVPENKSAAASRPTMRPHLYITATPVPGLRSLADVRTDIQKGHARELWEKIKQQADNDLHSAPLLPGSKIPGRKADQIQHQNNDYEICRAVGQRILRAALANLLTEEVAYRDAALRQLEVVFDEAQWPEWRDKAHLHMAADLRTGQLSHDIALAYDWLYPSLTAEQRKMIVAGIDRRGIRPYWEAIENKAYWINRNNNWMTCVVGGLGIVGMALAEDHPDSAKLIEFAMPRMKGYLEIYGPAGEFNESPGYAGANFYPVSFFSALRYANQSSENPLAQRPFPEACRWQMYLTLPPGRCVPFGDTPVNEAPKIAHVAAVAAANRDGVLQWFYSNYPPVNPDVRELVWYDPRVEAVSPESQLPLGKAFPAHGGCLVSRADWDPIKSPCIVFGKAGRENHHADDDVGQLCIDGFGKRLIVDVGMPSIYPTDYFGDKRTAYYNASLRGHNVLQFGGREMRPGPAGPGKILSSQFDPKQGASWTLDLTAAYDGVKHVRRTVLHHLPGIVAVLDEAETQTREEISLRWHTFNRCDPDKEGCFVVDNEGVQLSGRIIPLDGQHVELSRREHGYQPPYDRNRLGELLEQRRESFIQGTCTGQSCQFLTLFAVFGPGETASRWKDDGKAWTISTAKGTFTATITKELLSLQKDQNPRWSVSTTTTSAASSK